MKPDFEIYVSAWAALVAVIVTLAAYRWIKTKGEDRILHVRQSEFSMNAKQQANAQILDRIDRWGKVLTVGAVVYGCAILAAYLWTAINNVNR